LLRASRNPALDPGPRHLRARWLVLAGLAAILTSTVLSIAVNLIVVRSLSAELALERQSVAKMQATVHALEDRVSAQPDWMAIARTAELSIFTVETKEDEGSAWVAHSDANGSDLITNFHVVASAWSAADVTVEVHQGDRVMNGTITRVDRVDDLAVIHVAERFPQLQPRSQRPQLGETVMAIGSPLGLGGSVSVGVVSGFRSLDGSDFIQFSAPISPGNSGGPILDHNGQVIGVASAKFVGDGVEALSLAVPVQTVCATVTSCPTEEP